DHGLAVDLAPGRRRSLQDAELPVQALRDQVLVLRPHPGGRIPRGHRHASIGNATFPQSPLRITSIASSYRSSENLWVRRGRRFMISSTRRGPDRRTECAPTVFAKFIRYWFRWPTAITRRAPIARHRATAIRPIGPRPKIATVFPGTFALVVV